MKKQTLIAAASALIAAGCSTAADPEDRESAVPESENTKNVNDMPSEPRGSLTVQGRIEDGVECPALHTPDGDIYALALGEADFGAGDYVEIIGEVAEASICQQGKATIKPNRIYVVEPPARDRDPARAGGVKLTESYLTGVWVAKGVHADCANPDFSIRRSPGALVLEGEIEGHDSDAMVVLGDYPRLDLDEPFQDLPIESRGPDGVTILRPATDAEYDPVRIGSATITGDGVVFVKCSG